MMRGRAVLATLVLAALAGLGGCGSEEAGLTCGSGTHEEGGQCVADPSTGVDGGEDSGVQEDASDEEAGEDAAPPPVCETNGRCPTVEMVTVHWPNDEQPPYEIDAWETTFGEYGEFLKDADEGLVDAWSDPLCSDDFGLAPNESPCLTSWTHSDPTELDSPVVCISWCAAKAYCLWAGKRLCRGSLISDYELRGEWFNACSEGGTDPTGGQTCVPDAACEDAPGLFNLARGALEHVDGCDSEYKNCSIVAGSVSGGSDCSVGRSGMGTYMPDTPGIRCCR